MGCLKDFLFWHFQRTVKFRYRSNTPVWEKAKPNNYFQHWNCLYFTINNAANSFLTLKLPLHKGNIEGQGVLTSISVHIHHLTIIFWKFDRHILNVPLKNGSTFLPQGGGRSPRVGGGTSRGSRPPEPARCALRTKSGPSHLSKNCTKIPNWHYFGVQNLSLSWVKISLLVKTDQFGPKIFLTETNSLLNLYKMTDILYKWWKIDTFWLCAE